MQLGGAAGGDCVGDGRRVPQLAGWDTLGLHLLWPPRHRAEELSCCCCLVVETCRRACTTLTLIALPHCRPLPDQCHPLVPSLPLQARGLSSALSAASSACDHIRDWVLGTPGGWPSGTASRGCAGTARLCPCNLQYTTLPRCTGLQYDLAALPRYIAQPHYRATLPIAPLPPPPVSPAADGSWVSMGVYSDGSYGAPKVCFFCYVVVLCGCAAVTGWGCG